MRSDLDPFDEYDTKDIWDALQKKGLSATALEKVMGGNLHRVYREVVG